MFDDTHSSLQQKQQDVENIPITMPTDEEGYFDRQCPSDACHANFKVLMEDWLQKVSDTQVFCPVCREEAKATEWNTPEQIEFISQIVTRHIQNRIDQALSKQVQDFNRSQHPNFITLSMTYKPGAPIIIVPISAAKELRQKFICEQCRCRYSSLGVAFFCPACGHNSAESTFTQTIEIVRNTMAALSVMHNAVQSSIGEDAAQDTVRELLESNVGRLVGAFQCFAEALFESIPLATPIRYRKNAFQNLTQGSMLWQTATGKRYEDFLTTGEMSDLTRLFQQRHLLAHCEGIVDQDYIDKSGDTTYAVGQRIVIRDEAVHRLIKLVTTLVEGMRSSIRS